MFGHVFNVIPAHDSSHTKSVPSAEIFQKEKQKKKQAKIGTGLV